MIVQNIVVENADIGFRNFSGEEGKYNPKGRRNFCVFFDHEMGKTLEEDGWNVRWLDPKDDGDDPVPYLQVTVAFNYRPPNIFLVNSTSKTRLTEETVNLLDWAEIENVDVRIRPYNWEVNGKTGTKAYLDTIYVTIVEDEFAHKYHDIPDSARGVMMDEY